jgi:hypothetical protein
VKPSIAYSYILKTQPLFLNNPSGLPTLALKLLIIKCKEQL